MNCTPPPAIVIEIKNIADKYNIDPYIIVAIVEIESCFDPSANGDWDSVQYWSHGLMQIHRRGAGIGYNRSTLMKVDRNLDIGTKYIRNLLDQYGNLPMAISAYNQGPGALSIYGMRNIGYVHSVLYNREHWKNALEDYNER